MAKGTTFDFNLTRDQIIEKALRKVGGLASGETVSSDQLTDAIRDLNSIIRQMDVSAKNLWCISTTPTTLTLVANQFRYVTGATATTIPTNINELVTAFYRDAQANDTELKILTLEDYELLANKTESGDPEAVYLEFNDVHADRVLYVWPMRTTVNTQSVVTGTDAAAYRCIRSHTADSTNRPITGANYLLYWEAGGSSPATWATGTQYTSPHLLRFKYKRPLWDFDLATDNADLPQGLGRYLIYQLAFDLADDYGTLPVEERLLLGRKAETAYRTVFPHLMVPNPGNKTSHLNRARYM